MVFTDENMSSVYTKKILVGIEEIKKTNSMMTCKFLRTSLSTKLLLNSNSQVVQWRVTYTDRIADVLTDGKILLVNSSVIFNIWPSPLPSPISPSFLKKHYATNK